MECKKKPSKNYNNLRPPYWNAVHYFILSSFRWSLSLRSEKFNFQNKHYKCVGGGKISIYNQCNNKLNNKKLSKHYQNKDLFLNNKNNSNDILLRIRLWSNTHFSSAASFISIRIDPFPEQLTYEIIWITQIMCLLEGMENVSWMYLQKVYIIKSKKQNKKWFNLPHLYSFNIFQYNSNFIYVYIKHLRLKNLEHHVHTYIILW